MSEGEREYVVPLDRVLLAPKYRRAEKAVSVLRSFVARHVRARASDVKLDPALNELIWSRGIRASWRRIRVKVSKEEDKYRVSLP
ncbi:MAG: 50S ribosomal protein L31e [Conexivisphaera sp.]|nr:50S ribosomal protein L31e [uncultured archaeon]